MYKHERPIKTFSLPPLSQEYEHKLQELQRQVDEQSLISGNTTPGELSGDDDDDALESKLLTILFLAVVFWYIYSFSIFFISCLFIISCYYTAFHEPHR